MIELTAADGHRFSAYRADPADAPRGAVVVIQELSGVDAHIRSVAENLAANGYVAIAPALFDRVKSGVELGYSAAEFAEGMELTRQLGLDGLLADIQAAADAVRDAGRIACLGYCWGGYLAYTSANRVNGLSCAIGYYGGGIAEGYSTKRSIPTLLHFGEHDAQIPNESVAALRAQRPDVTAYTYAAGHGFDCEQRDSYDADAARVALERTLFWISQYVVGQTPVALKNAGAYAQQKVDKKKKKASEDLGPPAQ